ALNKAINIFAITKFTDPTAAGVVGISAAIGGPLSSGTASSGVIVATLGILSTENPSCNSSPCAKSTWDANFSYIPDAFAHEMGHFLGLNHPSELGGTTHDVLPDTPLCGQVS